jgi:hypothetical protein
MRKMIDYARTYLEEVRQSTEETADTPGKE